VDIRRALFLEAAREEVFDESRTLQTDLLGVNYHRQAGGKQIEDLERSEEK